jgi:hypothetical protein
MAKITRRQDLETEKDKFVAEYICECGQPVLYVGQEKPERLVRCFECALPIRPIDL